MTTNVLPLAIVFAAGFVPAPVWAQHDAHQPVPAQAAKADAAHCLRVQPVIHNIITAATSRAEAARLSNSLTELRAAVESLEAALRDIRTQSAPCSAAAASADPHAGHTMPTAQPPAGASPAPAGAVDPHAGHAMPGTPAGSQRGTATKPAPGTPARPASPDPHAGHAPAKAAEKHADPVNGRMVDPATALKTTYRGETYYFSSEQSRKEFLQNPAKFAKQPKGETP